MCLGDSAVAHSSEVFLGSDVAYVGRAAVSPVSRRLGLVDITLSACPVLLDYRLYGHAVSWGFKASV